jgi:hypothetical protein
MRKLPSRTLVTAASAELLWFRVRRLRLLLKELKQAAAMNRGLLAVSCTLLALSSSPNSSEGW